MSNENPITKERIDFRVAGAETGGRYTEADLFVGPGGYAAAEHIHPLQEERFEIRKGVLRLRVAGTERQLVPGDVALVQPGTPHVWSNGGDDELHMILRFTPALNAEEFFQSYFGLVAAGKSNAKGMITNPLQLAVMMEEFSDFIVPTKPPRWIQRAVAALAPMAKRLGYRAHPDHEVRSESGRAGHGVEGLASKGEVALRTCHGAHADGTEDQRSSR